MPVNLRRDGTIKGWALGFIPVWIDAPSESVIARSWTPEWLMFVCDLPIPYRLERSDVELANKIKNDSKEP